MEFILFICFNLYCNYKKKKKKKIQIHSYQNSATIDQYFCEQFQLIYQTQWDTRQRSWLRHYATSWKVAGSIPDEVTGFFDLPNTSSHTMTLGSTQTLTQMSTMNIHGGKGEPAR
jgi:hypothetical protein